MPAFVDDLSGFYGDGSKNKDGQTLEEFLEAYDARKYETPSCTTDVVIFSHPGKPDWMLQDFKILLVRRKDHPWIGQWALPGGFANMRENLEDTAKRELEEETGITGLPLEQLATYGDFDRDPRSRVITTAYVTLVNAADVLEEDKSASEELEDALEAFDGDGTDAEASPKEADAADMIQAQAADDAADAAWFNVELTCLGTTWDGEVLTENYELALYHAGRDLATKAYVRHTTHAGVIREQKFTVEESGFLAADHAAIIVQAMLHIRERLDASDLP